MFPEDPADSGGQTRGSCKRAVAGRAEEPAVARVVALPAQPGSALILDQPQRHSLRSSLPKARFCRSSAVPAPP